MNEQKKWFQHGLLVGVTGAGLMISLIPTLDFDGTEKLIQIGVLGLLFASTIYHYRKDCEKILKKDVS